MINPECIQDRILRTEVLTFSVPYDYQLWNSIPLTLSSAIPGFVIPTLGRFETDVWFYNQYYDIIEQFILTPGKKITLGSKKNRQCRFCSRSEPIVEFKNDAHAIPELLGNKVLFTAYECDGCNSMFGNGIEDDLGNWSKPMRALSRVRGKSGVPTVRKSKDGGWRVDCNRGELRVSQSQNDPIFEVDEAKK